MVFTTEERMHEDLCYKLLNQYGGTQVRLLGDDQKYTIMSVRWNTESSEVNKTEARLMKPDGTGEWFPWSQIQFKG